MSNLAASSQAYRQSAVLSATPGQRVVMLHDGARRFLHQAALAMASREVERAHNTLRRAELIIAHLDATLDHDQGELAVHLHSLYEFCLRHLDAGRLHQEPANLEQVSTLLGEMREAWAQAALAESSP